MINFGKSILYLAVTGFCAFLLGRVLPEFGTGELDAFEVGVGFEHFAERVGYRLLFSFEDIERENELFAVARIVGIERVRRRELAAEVRD